jgi:hypothetical protein
MLNRLAEMRMKEDKILGLNAQRVLKKGWR